MMAVGCARSPDVDDEVLARARAARDRACACSDLACAQRIDDKLAKWRDANHERLQRVTGQAAEIDAQLTMIGDEIRACMERLGAPPVAVTLTGTTTAVVPEPVPEPPTIPQPGDVEPPPAKPTPAMEQARSNVPSRI
jgi:hypothetical protein